MPGRHGLLNTTMKSVLQSIFILSLTLYAFPATSSKAYAPSLHGFIKRNDCKFWYNKEEGEEEEGAVLRYNGEGLFGRVYVGYSETCQLVIIK